MDPFVQSITTILAFGIIIGQVITVLLILSTLTFKQRGQKGIGSLAAFVGKYVLEIGFIATLGSVLGSLFYSNIAHFEPCEFCWWQRIMLYPQAIIFAVALAYKRKHGHVDRIATMTSLVMSIIGAGLALFQYYGQMFDPSLLAACVANGPSCSKLYFVSFGYITIPMMSLTTFAFLIVLVLAYKKISKRG